MAIVMTTGLITVLFAAFIAIFKHDLKGLLAYSTISHLGLITFLIGLGSPLAAVAALFHILNHASFKAALFMTAGIVDHGTGTRDMRQLGGLFKNHAPDGHAGDGGGGGHGRRAAVQRFHFQGNVFDRSPWLLPQGGGWRWLVPAAATLGGAVQRGLFGSIGA